MARLSTFLAALAIAAPAAASAGTHTIYFNLGSAKLDVDGVAAVDAAAADYRETGSATVSVVGYTDTTGSVSVNQEVSQKRAQAVSDALIARGVPSTAISTMAEGENDLAVPTGDGVAERENRRVVIDVSGSTMTETPMVAVPPMVEETFKGFSFGFGPYVGVNMQQGDDSVFLGLNFVGTYFATPNIALSVEQAVFWNLGADDEGVGGRTALGADYYFSDYGGDGILPYIGANGGYMYIDGSGTGGWFAGPEIGLSAFGFNAKVAYDFVEDRDAGDGVISITVGYSLDF